MRYVVTLSAFIIFFLSITLSFAQSGNVEINGRIIDESGRAVGDVKVSIESGLYIQATSMGKFRATLPSKTANISSVKIYKSGYKLDTWKFDKEKELLIIQITKLSQDEILNAKTIKGTIYNADGKPVKKAWITVEGVALMDVAITNEKGIFYLRIPPDENFSNKSKILVGGKHINASFVKYDEKKMSLYIMLKGSEDELLLTEDDLNNSKEIASNTPKSTIYEVNVLDENTQPVANFSVNAVGAGFFTTDDKGKFTLESKDIRSVKFIIKGFDKIKTDYTEDNKVLILVRSELPRSPRTEEVNTQQTQTNPPVQTIANKADTIRKGDYAGRFNRVSQELNAEKELFEVSSERVKGEIDKINEELEKDKSLNETQKQVLQSYMTSLEELLNDNAKVFEHNQQQTKNRLEMMRSVISAKNKIEDDFIKAIEKEKEEMQSDFRKNLLALSSVAAIFGVIMLASFALVRYMNRQKKKVEEANRNLAIATEQLKEKVDEINQKNEEMHVQAENLQKINQELHKKDTNITASLNYAQRLQKSTFPQIELIQQAIPECFILFQPKDIVSGDFYWFTERVNSITGNKQAFLVAADCTGHGVPGAFMSMVGDALLEKIINTQGISSPEKILNELHHGIRYMLNQEESENSDGMDMGLCVIDKTAKTMEYAGAKNPLFYVQDGELHTIKGTMMSLGGLQLKNLDGEKSFVKHTIDISKPTTCYLFSDGFPDQFGGETGKKYSKQRLSDLLVRIHQEDFEKQKELLAQEFENWRYGSKQTDDVLVMGFRA
jgi:serine phosphatase RsbU (regulator of sigma subunit)